MLEPTRLVLSRNRRAAATFSGYAVRLIDSNTAEDLTAASVGTNALGREFLSQATKASIAKVSARIAESIPGIGTVITFGSLALDVTILAKIYKRARRWELMAKGTQFKDFLCM